MAGAAALMLAPATCARSRAGETMPRARRSGDWRRRGSPEIFAFRDGEHFGDIVQAADHASAQIDRGRSVGRRLAGRRCHGAQAGPQSLVDNRLEALTTYPLHPFSQRRHVRIQRQGSAHASQHRKQDALMSTGPAFVAARRQVPPAPPLLDNAPAGGAGRAGGGRAQRRGIPQRSRHRPRPEVLPRAYTGDVTGSLKPLPNDGAYPDAPGPVLVRLSPEDVTPGGCALPTPDRPATGPAGSATATPSKP